MVRLAEAVGHEDDHGPQDHGFVAGGQVLVVADGAAVLADPGEGPLDYPAARQDLEGVRVTLGDDLDGQAQGRGPGGQLAGGVSGGQQQATGVDGDVPLAAVDLLGVIPAPGGPGHGVGGAGRLGVDHRRGRLGIPARGLADLGAQRIVQPGQRAVVPPGGEVAVHRLPRREVGGQVPPGAPGPVQVQDRFHDPPGRPDPGPAPVAGDLARQVRGDHLPLRVGQVTGIAPGPEPGPARTLGTRGPTCTSGRHTSGSWGARLAYQPNDTRPGPGPRHRFIKRSLSDEQASRADKPPGVSESPDSPGRFNH
jgi:hypothetical protein